MALIELKNITKRFYKQKNFITALSDVSLSVEKGRISGVIGESGAGKSTLIRCVNLLERPTSGEVTVNGQSLMQLSGRDLAKARTHIGMIFQHFNLMASQTVFDNIALPLRLQNVSKAAIQTRVTELLELVGLREKYADYPSSLSGGQKQRVAIARALSTDPRVLLCDEATSSLDPATTKSILSLLKDINTRLNITILLITHEMDVVKAICDDVAVMSEGKMIEQGPVASMFRGPLNELNKKFIHASNLPDVPEDY